MESTAKPSTYFSAYPLKAVKESSVNKHQPESPYLKAILSGTKTNGDRSKVFPMVNSPKRGKMPSIDESKLPKDIELTEKTWFNNYE